MFSFQKWLVLGSTLALLFGVSVTPQLAWAQKSAAAKALGDVSTPFWSAKAAGHRMRRAADYGRWTHQYMTEQPQPQMAVVKEAADEVLRDLDTAKEHLAVMRKQYAGDKETLAAVDRIEKHLTEAMDQHTKLCTCCEGKEFQEIMAMKCCNDMTTSLEKALGEHDALMRSLSAGRAQERTRK